MATRKSPVERLGDHPRRRARKTGGSAWSRAKEALKSALPHPVVFHIKRVKAGLQQRLVQVPAVPLLLDIVHDESFQRSVREIKYITEFDSERLANLWQLCRLSEPGGTILEVGVNRGGTALHLMNCRPDARFVLADTFTHVDLDEVMRRLRRKGRDLTVLRGIFPDSDTLAAVDKINFAHIDVVVYQSCRRALEYVSQRCRPSAIIVVNDVLMHPWGVTEALCEFVDEHPEWMALPLYPGQAVIVSRDGNYPFARLAYAPDVAARIARHRLPTDGTKANPVTVD